jgi:hypothetical protein
MKFLLVDWEKPAYSTKGEKEVKEELSNAECGLWNKQKRHGDREKRRMGERKRLDFFLNFLYPVL